LALLGLGAMGRRSIGAFAVAGAAAGAAFTAIAVPATGGQSSTAAFVAIAAIGALHLVITRAVAGIRTPG